MRRRGRRRSGASPIEAAVLAVFWLPLLLIGLSAGTGMLSNVETLRIARDAARMYGRGADFSQAGPRAALARLGGSMGLAEGGASDGVVILSTIVYVGRQQCRAYNLAGPDGEPDAGCANYGRFVIVQRHMIGNAGLHASRYGNPRPDMFDARTGNIDPLVYLSDPDARAGAFDALPEPCEGGAGGYRAGQPAYVAEVMFRARDLAGFGVKRDTRAEVIF